MARRLVSPTELTTYLVADNEVALVGNRASWEIMQHYLNEIPRTYRSIKRKFNGPRIMVRVYDAAVYRKMGIDDPIYWSNIMILGPGSIIPMYKLPAPQPATI